MSSDVAKSTNMSEAKDEPMEEDGPVSEDEAPEKGQADQGVRRRQPRSHGGIAVGDIIEGKREKKTVQRLDFQISKPKERLKIENGSGDKLGDIARSNHHIGKMKVPDLKPLHKILFDRPGAVATMRKNMRLFNGFAFEVDSDPYVKKRERMMKITNSKLRTICKVLDLEKGGNQSVLIDRILTFLMAPKITGKLVISKKKKKSKKNISAKDTKGKTKAKPKSASSSPRKPKAESKSKAIVTDSSSEDDDEEEEDKREVTVELDFSDTENKGGKTAKKDKGSLDDTDDSADEDDDEEDDEEDEEPKSKTAAKGKATAKKRTPAKKPSRPAKKAAPAKKKMKKEISDQSESDSNKDEEDEDDKDSESEVEENPKKKTAAKRPAPAKPAAKTKKADSSSNRRKKTTDKDKGADDSSDDDEPLIKMIKKPPSDEQLKDTVKGLLKEANLEEMTMKQICQKVYDTYPEYDLASRKDYIKATVKTLIS